MGAEEGTGLRILVVRSWDLPIAPLREALTVAGLRAELIRVDIEPALVAALGRRNIDAIIYAPGTRGIPFAVVKGLVDELGLDVPVVTFGEDDDVAAVAAQLAAATRARAPS